LAPKAALTSIHDAKGPSKVFAASTNPGFGVMERRTQVKEDWVVIPENVTDSVVFPGLLQEATPLEEMLAIEGSVIQVELAVTSVVVPLE
jgi:hypothetical protein